MADWDCLGKGNGMESNVNFIVLGGASCMHSDLMRAPMGLTIGVNHHWLPVVNKVSFLAYIDSPEDSYFVKQALDCHDGRPTIPRNRPHT